MTNKDITTLQQDQGVEISPMTNKEISKILQEIADMLELRAANVFEIRAYQQAARAIEYSGEEMTEAYRKGGVKALDEIPSVGASIADHIRELLETGKLKKYDKLRTQIPEVELQILEIPGVGPKTAKKLYETLKPRNRDELTSVLKKGLEAFKLKFKNQKSKVQIKIQKLEQLGLREKSFENILRGIEILEKQEGRLQLVQAVPIVEEVTKYMKKAPGLDRFDAVGSYRRQRETVGDIDIVASLQTQNSKLKTQNAMEIIDRFVTLPFVQKVINKGETKTRVIHESGIQIDLEILPKEEYGSLLQHFTGSKEHNVALRTWGVEHGFSISEHGIKINQKSKIPASPAGSKNQNDKVKIKKCSDEECVYYTLGMQWIPPELRENRGEIEAALKHKLPKLIELKDIKGDLQVHTNWSDGHNTIWEMAKTAQDLGYQYIALTDHSIGLGVARGLDQKRFDDRHKKIVAAQKKLKIKILEGVEVDIRANGGLDLPNEVLKKLDYVMAAIHSSFNQDRETMTRRIIGAIEHPLVQAIAHPTGRLIGHRPSYEVDWPAVFQAAAKRKKALEIDGFPNRLDLPDNYVFEAKKYGVKFVIGTDSHKVEHLPYMRFGISVARRGWLTKHDILNTMKIEALLDWFRK